MPEFNLLLILVPISDGPGTSHDPQGPEFRSWRSYRKFARQVQTERRFVWDVNIQSFLDTVSKKLEERAVEMGEGQLLWRAQLGIEPITIVDDDDNVVRMKPHGFRSERMKPLPSPDTEGRVNPVGIPVLYMATSRRTAISEVRPGIGHGVSVAQFRVRRGVVA